MKRHDGYISFAGLRARCLERYPTEEVARWILMEAIVTSGIRVTGDMGSVSFISSVREARSVVPAKGSSHVLFDEMMNREELIAVTPWWTPSEDGVIYRCDSSRSWFIRWEKQFVIHNALRVTFVPATMEEIHTKGCGTWMRYRSNELRQMPLGLSWESIVELGDASIRLDTRIRELHGKIRETYSWGREYTNTISCDAAREVLYRLCNEWPNLASVLLEKNLDVRCVIRCAFETLQAEDWVRKILRRAVAGVGGGSVKVALPNEKSIILLGNRRDSSNSDLKVSPTNGEVLVTCAKSGVVRTVRSLVDVAESCSGLRQDEMLNLITGIKILTFRLAAGSILPRKDDWLSPIYWPQTDNRLLSLGNSGPSQPEPLCPFDDSLYEFRKDFGSPESTPAVGQTSQRIAGSPEAALVKYRYENRERFVSVLFDEGETPSTTDQAISTDI